MSVDSPVPQRGQLDFDGLEWLDALACRSAGRGETINSPSRISATLWSGTWQRSSYVARRRMAVSPLMRVKLSRDRKEKNWTQRR